MFAVQSHERITRKKKKKTPRCSRERTDPRSISRKKMYEQSLIAPQKPNRRSPHAEFSGGRGFRRYLLSRSSVRVEVRDGEIRKLLNCVSLGSGYQRISLVWTDGRQDI